MKNTDKMGRTIIQLEKMYNTMKAELFDGDLPETVIVVNRTKQSYGHSSVHKVWSKNGEPAYELCISSETLALPIAETIDTMIHEMVHLYCRKHEIREVSANGYYHNDKFRELAESKGLKCVKEGKDGWNTTAAGNEWLTEYAIQHDWPEFRTYQKRDFSADFAEMLNQLGQALEQQQNAQPETKQPGQKKGSYIRWQCPKCKAIVRSTKKLNIVCGDCQETFIET